MKPRIVVVGGGTGGMVAAYEMQEALGATHQIILISDVDYFQFYPSNPWVAVGWRKREDITFPIRPYVERKNIIFYDRAVVGCNAEQNQLTLADGQIISYDYLLIATGAQLDFPAVSGSGPHHGWSESVCTVDHAEHAYGRYQQFLQNPGSLVVGALPGASCFGPAYEYALILARDLKKRGLRDRVHLSFVTSEPYIGHMGLAGVGKSKEILTNKLREEGFDTYVNAAITHIDSEKVYFDEKDSLGKTIRSHAIESRFSMLLPAFRGIPVWTKVPELCNEKGMILVDPYMRSIKYSNIFAVGLTVALPPVEVTPVPTNTPKTGYMIESMVTTIVTNLKNELQKIKAEKVRPTLNAVCIADTGDAGLVFVALPQIKPRRVDWFTEGRWVHLAKVAFEKYFMHKMKSGHSEPLYEYLTFKLLGITRTEKDSENMKKGSSTF